VILEILTLFSSQKKVEIKGALVNINYLLIAMKE
jgi:hypothetical protein